MNENIPLMTKSEMMDVSILSLSSLTGMDDIKGSRNILICMTEMNELSEELCKYLLQKDYSLNGILEEYADVQLAIWYLCMLCELPEQCIESNMAHSDLLKGEMTKNAESITEAIRRMNKCSHKIGDYLRGRSKNIQLQESVSNVQMSLTVLKNIFGFTDEQIYKSMTIKMLRVKERILLTGEHK